MTIYQVDRERWARFTFIEQMGNIGSEVGRAIIARKAGRDRDCQQAVIRALDLFDATVEGLIAEHSPRAKEVLRSKEEFLRSLYDSPDPAELDAIDQYFFQFALASRQGR